MSDSDMNVKSLDSDKDVTSGLHARSKRLERSTPDALGQRNGTQSHLVPTSVTITISRISAEGLVDGDVSTEARNACRAALLPDAANTPPDATDGLVGSPAGVIEWIEGEIERLEETLRYCADTGCLDTVVYAKSCLDSYPTTWQTWCGPCAALAALYKDVVQ